MIQSVYATEHHAQYDAIPYHEHHDQPMKRRRISVNSNHVRFNDNVTFIGMDDDDKASTSDGKTSTKQQDHCQTPHSSWLAPNDLTKIQNGVFTTLEMIKVQGDFFGLDTPLASRYCSRGLENLDVNRKGCLKMATIERRQAAICAVMNEQAFHRQQYMQKLRCVQGAMSMGFGTASRNDCHMVKKGSTKASIHQRRQYKKRLQREVAGSIALDHDRIREIYEHQSFFSSMEAIELGRKDSEDALAVYRSEPLPIATNVVPVDAV